MLEDFGNKTTVRGRFVAIYLGLRHMGNDLARLGAANATPTKVLEQSLDLLFTKTHRPEPFVVLTAPFGGSTSTTAPYSTRTGVTASGHSTPTNTWRNNFGIQKGVGCPAEPETIDDLLNSQNIRAGCPHMAVDRNGQRRCELAGTTYRGEQHSVWLRMTGDGFQVVNLDHHAVWDAYLRPGGERIPIFSLIAVLYSFAPPEVYPQRSTVGIPDFVSDFSFELSSVEERLDCDPESPANARVLAAVSGTAPLAAPEPRAPGDEDEDPPLPALPPAGEINTGVGAELAVADQLIRSGWQVVYRGNQRGFGYDLEATRREDIIRVEVKSSVSFTTPELLASEWKAAQQHGDSYILAVVDFYGSDQQSIWYTRNPAGNAVPVERTTTVYRLLRNDVKPLRTDVDFL